MLWMRAGFLPVFQENSSGLVVVVVLPLLHLFYSFHKLNMDDPP